MKLESLSFGQAELAGFRHELMEYERGLLVRRLEAAGGRLTELGARVADDATAGEGWNAREVLAHVAVLSKFYGVAAKRVADGTWTEIDLLAFVNQRDVAGEATAKLPVPEVLAMALADNRRTVDFVRQADLESLYRRATVAEGVSWSAEQIVRLALCAHLELHLEQLAAALESA